MLDGVVESSFTPSVAWINGIPTSPAFPLHPSQSGEQNMANQVLADF